MPRESEDWASSQPLLCTRKQHFNIQWQCQKLQHEGLDVQFVQQTWLDVASVNVDDVSLNKDKETAFTD